MKTFVYVGILILLSFDAFNCLAQNRSAISLNNYDSGNPIYYSNVGTRAAGTEFYVQILGGADSNALAPLTSTGGTGNTSIFNIGTGIDPAGFFDGGIAIISGVAPLANASFQVRAWTGAPTFEEASQRVISAVFNQQTGILPPTLGAPAPAALNFPANLVIPAIPESSVVILILIGLGGLVSGRWQKLCSGIKGRGKCQKTFG